MQSVTSLFLLTANKIAAASLVWKGLIG